LFQVWAASTDDGEGNAIAALSGVAGRPNQPQASLFGWPKTPIGQCVFCLRRQQKGTSLIAFQVWGECNQDCPSGFTPATGTGGKVSGLAGIFNGCKSGESRYYCCPTGSKFLLPDAREAPF
jgi:hypothetical protein